MVVVGLATGMGQSTGSNSPDTQMIFSPEQAGWILTWFLVGQRQAHPRDLRRQPSITRVIHFLYPCVWAYASTTLCPACVHLDPKHSVAFEWLLRALCAFHVADNQGQSAP